MSAVNPYQPPQAAVGEAPPAAGGYSTPRFWSASGRIGRLRFLSYQMVGYLVMGLVAGVLGGIARAAGAPELAGVVALLVVIPYFVFSVMTYIQRSHDMDWSGWSFLLCLIPFVALIWVFKGGTKGANRWGNPPPPNGTGVIVGACVAPAIVVIGILAAVAIPAYADYTKRAKAAQQRAEQRLPDPSPAAESDNK